MDIPAPISLGPRPATTILAGPAMAAGLEECRAAGRAPVLLHELGGEKARASLGPRELLEQTRARLEKASPELSLWGAGAQVSTSEEAAQFATAGYTWFRLDLARLIDSRAEAMTLEALDATIVALEDLGLYPAEWHTAYVDREFTPAEGVSLWLPDETLARAAIKFAPVLARAEEIDQVIRQCWSGRGEPPDLEVVLSPSGPASTVEELLFLSLELKRRLSSLPLIAPALGHEWQPGQLTAQDAEPLQALLIQLSDAIVPARISLPATLGALLPSHRPLHQDATEAGRLAFLTALLQRDPLLFRDWLEAARLAFPIARHGWPLSVSEEEARFLPQVNDAALAETFLETLLGRQVLLATWSDVSTGDVGERARALLG